MLLQRTDGLHKGTFKIITDTHDLSGCLHLSRQCTFCTDEFIEWKSWNLYYTVVKHRLKACVSLLRNRILNLIQSITKCNLSRNLGNRISCCLRCKCRRTADTRIHLDNTVLKCLWMQCILYVTSSCNIQLTDNIQCRSTKHLILFISQRLRRCYNDTVTGMNAARLNIFHITYSNTVTIAVTHHLILDLFPSGDTTLNQNLTNTRKTKSIFQNLYQLRSVVCDTAAASS